MIPQVGQPAPEFTEQAVLSDGSTGEVSLSAYLGKWVVLFFWPLDFTFVCPTEIQGFQKQRTLFEEFGTQIIGVSTDSVYAHQAWKQHGLGEVDYPMVGDTAHRVSRAYGVLIEETGIALRGTFIIDPEGVIRQVVVNDLPVGRSVDETLRMVQALQTGGLTACEWQPGEATLSV